MDSYEQQGIKVADFALEILAGKNPSGLPHQTKLPLQYRVDARQLERWGFKESYLPPGVSIEFRQPGLWKQYKTPIIFTFLGVAALVGIIALLLRQIHKRRKAEASLKESEDRMAFAASSTNVGLRRMDIATGHVWATDHCRSMFGIAPDTALTLDILRDAVHPEDRQTFGDCMEFATHTGLSDNQFRVTLPGHDVRWLAWRARTVSDEHGTPLQVSGLFADITTCKSAEADAASQREEIAHLLRVAALGELSGGIAHELGQPLAAILANAQAAQSLLSDKAPDTETLAQILDDIVDDDRRAGQVIHRLGRLLKKGEHQAALLNFNDLVRSTLTLLHAELVHRKIKVDLDLKPELPLISGDSVQLQQVLLNLMMNAMQAMDSTTAAHRRTLHQYARDKGRICRGPGVGLWARYCRGGARSPVSAILHDQEAWSRSWSFDLLHDRHLARRPAECLQCQARGCNSCHFSATASTYSTRGGLLIALEQPVLARADASRRPGRCARGLFAWNAAYQPVRTDAALSAHEGTARRSG